MLMPCFYEDTEGKILRVIKWRNIDLTYHKLWLVLPWLAWEKNDLGFASHETLSVFYPIREEKGANPNTGELGFQEMYKCI